MSAREKTKARAPFPDPAKEKERQKEIERLEKDVEELRHLAGNEDADAELGRIREQVGELRREFYAHLGPWQRAQIARHQQRPYTLDFIGLLFTDFIELHGDRGYADDKAIITGLGKFHGRPVAIIGDRVNILENSFYSVISREGCASIIWRDSTKAETAAAAMKITAKDLKELGIVDEIVPEPEGGAHTDHEGAARFLDEVLDRQLA